MRTAGGALALALAALIVCCTAESHQEHDATGNDHVSGEHYDAGHKSRALDTLGIGNLVREVRDFRRSGYVPYLLSRRFDFASAYGGKHEPWAFSPFEYARYYGDAVPKRNFDEIDRSGLNTFVNKRNFDEIDRSSIPFPYATKRFNALNRDASYSERNSPSSKFDRKRALPEYPMDEIDLSMFPIGGQWFAGSYPAAQHALL